MSRLSWRHAAGLVLVLALVVRLGAIAVTPEHRLVNDPLDYDRHARSIAAGDGYPPSGVVAAGGATAIRPPGYPAFLGAVYALTGDSPLAGRIAQALLGTAIVALTMVIAVQLWGALVAVVAGLLAAVFPPLVVTGMALLSEPLFVVLVLASVAAVLRWRATGRLPWLLVCGVGVGLACLTRSNGGLVLLAMLFAARRDGSWRSLRSYRPSLVVLLCALAVVTPWTVRNAIELRSFVVVTTQDGFTLAGTYNATSHADDGIWRVPIADPAIARLTERHRGLSEAEMNARLRSAARRYAADHPAYVAEVAARNTLRLFNLGGTRFQHAVAAGDHGLGPRWGDLLVIGILPFLVAAAGGALTRAARRAPAWFWSIPVLLCFPVFILATNRTRAPIDPFLLMLAALGVTAALRRVR